MLFSELRMGYRSSMLSLTELATTMLLLALFSVWTALHVASLRIAPMDKAAW